MTEGTVLWNLAKVIAARGGEADAGTRPNRHMAVKSRWLLRSMGTPAFVKAALSWRRRFRM